MQLPRKPEIMSPAGHWPQLRAAIEAGADSVYFGLKHFTARAKAGFDLEELPEAIRTLHQRGVRGLVTFNTLVFDHELKEAARVLAAIAEAGADAIIVQDAGILKLARAIAPGLEIHGSTQMSVTSVEGVELARKLGADRVTLARELSLDEVRAIRARTDCGLEIFVHGALCVAYSGQCLSSEAWGGRSANRGQCAQACRLPYEMVVDGQLRPLADARYLLSPGDLAALHHIPEIVKIGLSALKIEGRYKEADYVALTTRAYRQAVDEAWAGLPLSVTERETLELEQVYSRGLAPHFLSGVNHQAVVDGRAPRHRGVRLGRVVRLVPDGVVVEPAPAHKIAALKAGDGVVFDAADWRSPEEREEGGRVFQVIALPGGKLELRFGNGAIELARIRPGDLLWRTHDPEIGKAARPYLEAASPVARQLLNVRVTAHEGEPLRTCWSVAGVQVELESPGVLGRAEQRGLSAEYLREQLGRLGGSAYRLGEVELDVAGNPFAPASLLNQIRREAVEQLARLQSAPALVEIHDPAATVAAALAGIKASPVLDGSPRIHLLVRTPDQLEAALLLEPASITLDYLDLYGLKPSVERVKATGIAARVASPRVLKPGEERVVDFLLKLDCPILVRSAGLLEQLRHNPKIAVTGDFSLNAANALTAGLFLECGMERLTPAFDLNAEQVADLARSVGPGRIEAVAYQHLPVFHTEHCVFCRFLSTGTSYKDCGRPCEKHRVEVRDPQGRSHPVLADVGCRNTVFGAQAQEASLHLEAWMQAGIRHYRLEFVHESAAQVTRIARAVEAALTGRTTYGQLNRELRQIAPQGATEGSFFVPANYLTLPILQ